MALRPNSGATAAIPSPRIVPAQVNFLTIYNPTLGDTEETEKDQIVFWAGKDELGLRRTSRSTNKSSNGPAAQDNSTKDTPEAAEEQLLNERLRQIGLARGMVEFTSNFSTEHPLDTIETDRSRIVLHELEKDWWILTSIDLTRLPATPSQTKSSGGSAKEAQPQYEYSAREVSPATLLRTQLVKAHNLFLLHHASNLWELYNKLGRPTFCAILNRFWEAFARSWDVMLHGNPAVDVYGDCIKLAGGGELGVGVGEEEWGSGEREVLEGFVERAHGLIDCVVGRYGVAPPDTKKTKLDAQKKKNISLEEKVKFGKEAEPQPWLGSGDDPGPADGIVFSGVGTISKRSLATVSQWMEAIFRNGDAAYGVGENPASRPRQRRKRRPKPERQASDDPPGKSKEREQQGADIHTRLRSPRNKAPDWRRKAMENNAAPPGIPAPLVGAVERSLDDALLKAAQRSSSKSPKTSPKSSPNSSPRKERSEQESMQGFTPQKEDSGSVFSMEGVKNMFSFGYGSSWTLNPNGFDKKDEKVKKSKSHERPKTPPTDEVNSTSRPTIQRSTSSGTRPAEERLQEIDPTPESSDEDMHFMQKLEQSIGRFLIGLSGDLENNEFDDTDEPMSFGENNRRSGSQRIFLRTLTVELTNTYYQRPGLSSADRKQSQTSTLSKASIGSKDGVKSSDGPEPKTSAAASVDGAQPNKRYEKVQVAVYVHQPFVFVFLFELHNPKLTMPGFYRTIHHQLGPLQKPLLQRTNPTRISERMTAALNEKASAAVSAVKKHVDMNGNAIYDLVYDPSKGTIRTSIPNIPIPTSPDAVIKTSSTVSGAWYTLGIPLGTSNSPSTVRLDPTSAREKVEPWTRVEALNVHIQIFNTFAATRNPNELERTVKTGKGWWVLWMNVAARDKESEELKEAFLIRKSADYTVSRPGKESGSKSSGGSPAGRWLLRDQSRDTSGGTNFSGTAGGLSPGAKGVSEGVGIDAKKWIEGLLSLTQ